MKSFNYQDVAILLQEPTAEAKHIISCVSGEDIDDVKVSVEVDKKQLDEYLLKKGFPNVDELLRRRSLIHHSQEQFKKILRDGSCIKSMSFPKKFRVYNAVLSDEVKQKCYISWMNWHSIKFNDESLEEVISKMKNTRFIY